MKKIILELSKFCFTLTTGLLLPLAFVVFCFQVSFEAVVELASKVWSID